MVGRHQQETETINGIKKNRGKLIFWVNEVIVGLIIITCILTKDFTLISFSDSRQRPYGSTISLTFPLMLTVAIFVVNVHRFHFNSCKKMPIVAFFAYAVISGLFLPVNGGDVKYYIVAVYKIMSYVMLLTALMGLVHTEELLGGIDKGFKVSLIAQTVIGSLYVFWGILVPYVANYSTTIRNGLPRMTGSAIHPGDFSLYIGILFVYFVCNFLFRKRKGSLIYAAIAFMDIMLSGARTMLLVSCFVALVILARKYRKKAIVKFGISIAVIITLIWFYNSSAYENLFVTNNIFDMFMARYIHWIIGFKILFDRAVNFLFGVGLNFHVDYINSHYSSYASLILKSNILSDEFVNNNPIHNSFLIVGCELGIVGLILHLRVYVKGVVLAKKNIKYRPSARFENYFVISSFAVFAFYSMQGWAMMKNTAWTMYVIVISLLYSSSKKNGTFIVNNKYICRLLQLYGGCARFLQGRFCVYTQQKSAQETSKGKNL